MVGGGPRKGKGGLQLDSEALSPTLGAPSLRGGSYINIVSSVTM